MDLKNESPYFWLSHIIAFFYAFHFFIYAKRSPQVLARKTFAVSLITVALFSGLTKNSSLGLFGFVLTSCFAFGYANSLAFLKRGITFSILQNHLQPREKRIPDVEFIDLEMRKKEMLEHGWIQVEQGKITLLPKGVKVAKLYQLLLNVFKIDVIG